MPEKYIKFSKSQNAPNTIAALSIKDRKYLLLTYLFFNQNPDDIVHTSINSICGDLNYCLTNKGMKNHQNSFRETLDTLIKENVIQFYPTVYMTSYESITDQKLFVIQINNEILYSISTNYVDITFEEFNKILSASKSSNIAAHKLFNVYLVLKSLMTMGKDSLHYCYPSFRYLATSTASSVSTIATILTTLYTNKLIYIYNFLTTEHLKDKYHNVELVFALEQYPDENILQEFLKTSPPT